MINQCVILAGGLGTRLRPITEKIPKALVEVNGKPFLYWQLLDLKQQGFQRVLLLTGYLGEQVESVFGDGSSMGLHIEYSREESPMGTGGALRLAHAQLDSHFILLNGDSFLKAPLQQMTQEFQLQNFAAMISYFSRLNEVSVPANLRLERPSERVSAVIQYEKGAGQEKGFQAVDSGVYVLSSALFDPLFLEGKAPDGKKYPLLKDSHRFQLEDLWLWAMEHKKLGAFLVEERFYDIGTPERLRIFEEKIGDYFPNAL